jgi:hypothetical protein
VTGGVRRRRGAEHVERADLVERVVVASSVWPVPHGSRRSRCELEAIGVTSLALDALNDHRRGQLDHHWAPTTALEVAVRGGTRSKKMLTRKVPTPSRSVTFADGCIGRLARPIREELLVRTEHLLGVVVNWPSVGLTDDFCAPCWSVRRIPTHGRLTPCEN